MESVIKETNRAENVRLVIQEMVDDGCFIGLGVKPGHIGSYPIEIVDIYKNLTGQPVFAEEELGVSVVSL